MAISIAASSTSHIWTLSVAYAALYGPTSVDDGTPLELDGSVLDVLGESIYARRAVALYVETDGMAATASSVEFGIPAGSTICWFGLLDADGQLLAVEPISESVRSNVPQACLFTDLDTGWIDRPGSPRGPQQTPGAYVVLLSDHAPESGLFATGGYTTLPSNIWAEGHSAIWPVRDTIHERFLLNARVGLSAAAASLSETDALIPSNRGWGYWQRIDPVTYTVAGTYTLGLIRVRSVG